MARVERSKTCRVPPSWKWSRLSRCATWSQRHGRPQEVEVQVIALGNDVAWVSLPGEIFTELGLAIKQDSPFPHTIIAELANGVNRLHSRSACATPRATMRS